MSSYDVLQHTCIGWKIGKKPLSGQDVELDAKLLLDWVSRLGLTASRIDLDQGLFPPISKSAGDFQVPNPQPLLQKSEAEPAFLDIKVTGAFHKIRAAALVGGILYLKCMENGHPNFTMLFGEECSTIRLTLGLDPSQIEVLTDCFKTIHSLN